MNEQTQPEDLIRQLQQHIVRLEQENQQWRSQHFCGSTPAIDRDSSLAPRLLEATAKAANALLTTTTVETAVLTALQILGESLETDRVKILECFSMIHRIHPLPITR